MSKPNRETVRRFVAAALCDLVAHLAGEDEPLVVGGGYSKTKLVQATTRWATRRGISLENPDGKGWLIACKTGAMHPYELGDTS